MPKVAIENLVERGTTVSTEQIEAANSRERIGQLFLDLFASAPLEWSGQQTYLPGQWVIWKGRLVRCITATNTGESPASKPAKWQDFVVSTLTQLLHDNVGDNLVTAGAVKALVAQAVSGGREGVEDIPIPSSVQQTNEKKDNTTFITPYLLGLVVNELSKSIGESGDNAQTLQSVTDNDPVSDNVITNDRYQQPVRAFVQNYRGVVVAVKTADSNIERFEVADVSSLGNGPITPVTHDYRAGITNNACTTISGFVIDVANPNTPASFYLYIDDVQIVLVQATLARPDIATQFNVTSTSNIFGWSCPIPAVFQDNYIHSLSLREVGTGKVLYTASTPGNCKIGDNQPTPRFNIRGQFEEAPLTNIAKPIFIGPFDDVYIDTIGDKYFGVRGDEFYSLDRLTLSSIGYLDGKEVTLPYGVTFDPNTILWRVPGTAPNAKFVVKVIATDSLGQTAFGYRLVTINRSTGPTTPYIVEKKIGGADLTEGGAEKLFYVRHIMSSGPEERYAGPGEFRFKGRYPNYMTFTPVPNAAGTATTRIFPNTIESDIDLTIEFVINGAVVATGVFRGINTSDPLNPDNPGNPNPPVQTKVVTTLEIFGPDEVNEGAGGYITGKATYDDGSTETTFSKFKASIAAATGDFDYNDFGLYNASGCQLNANGTLIASKNDTPNDSRDIRVKIEFGGKSAVKTIHIVDTTPANVTPITAVGIIYPAGWKTAGNAEKLKVYVSVPAGQSVSIKYPNSVSNTAFRAMEGYDWANNPHVPGDANPPQGYKFTHVLELSGENFSGQASGFNLVFHTTTGPDLTVATGVYAGAADLTFTAIYY